MSEQEKTITLSEYKKQISQSENNEAPITLSEYKKSLVQESKPEEVGFAENIWRVGGGAVRDVLQSSKEAAEFGLRTYGKIDPKTAALAQVLDLTPDIPEVPEPTTSVTVRGVDIPVGSLARDIAGFAIPYTQITKGVQAVSAIPKGASLFEKGLRATTIGSVAEQFAFSPTEERLSNLIQAYPSLQNPITEYLQADKGDSEAEARLKMAIEGSALGGTFEVIFGGLRAIKNVRKKDVPQETIEISESVVKKSEEANKEIEQVIPPTPKEQPDLTIEQVKKQREEATKEPFIYDKNTDTYKAKIKEDSYEILQDAPGSFRVFKTEPLTPQQIEQRLLDDVTGELKVENLLKEKQMLPYEQSFNNLSQAKRFVIEESRPTKLPENLQTLPQPKDKTKIPEVNAENIERRNKIQLLESFGVRPEKTTKEEVDVLVGAAKKKAESLNDLASLSKAETERAKLIQQDIEAGNVGLPSLKNYKDAEVSPPPLTDKDIADVIPRLRTPYEDYVANVDINNKFIDEIVEPIKPGEVPQKKSKYIINVNMNRLDASIPERKNLEQIAKEYEEPLDIARNVTQFGSNGENLKALAEETGLSLDELLKGNAGKVLDPVNMYKLRVAHAEALKEVTDLSSAMKDTSKSSPELKYEFDLAITRYVSILEKLVGQAAEAGRVLKSFDVPVKAEDGRKTKLITKYFKENKGRSDILDVIADAVSKLDDPQQVSKFLREAWKPTVTDKILEAWINFILSAPPTHIVNMLSNAFNVFLSAGEQGTAAVYGLLKGAKDADKVTFKELGARLVGNLVGFADGLKAGTKALIDEDYITDPFLKVELARQRAIGGITGKIIRIPTRALAAEDLFFKAINYRQELMGLAARQAVKEGKKGFGAVKQRVKEILENPIDEFPDLDLKATEYARYQTYTNPLGQLGQATQNFLSSPYFKLGRFIAPFIRTPVNIVKYAFERTPLGTISKRYKDAIDAGGAEADIAKSKIIFSGAVMSTLGLYANQGLITGRGPEDPRERAVLRETGWQEYSIKVGDKYISYQRFEPFGILLGLTADFVNAANMVGDNVLVGETDQQKLQDRKLQEELEKIGAYLVASFADNITNKTYLRGVSELIKAMDDPERYGSTYINNFLSSPIPNVFGYVRRFDDPYIRDARILTDTLMNKIPGMSTELPSRRNIFGEPIKYSPGAAPDALGKVGKVFSPARETQLTNDIVFNELLDIEYYPGMPGRTIKGIDLNTEQYEYMMAQHILLGTKQQVLEAILYPEYKDLSKYGKRQLIKEIIVGNNEIAREETLLKYPDLQEKIDIRDEQRLEE